MAQGEAALHDRGRPPPLLIGLLPPVKALVAAPLLRPVAAPLLRLVAVPLLGCVAVPLLGCVAVAPAGELLLNGVVRHHGGYGAVDGEGEGEGTRAQELGPVSGHHRRRRQD
uniref:Uncharacterized protein n=1 Tax=Setaria italica TaxID=4555 RepID=K3ZAY2_SETIT